MLSCWLQQFDSTIQMLPDQTSVNYSLRSLFFDGAAAASSVLRFNLTPMYALLQTLAVAGNYSSYYWLPIFLRF